MIRTVLAAALALGLAACGKAAPESDDPLPGAPATSPATAVASAAPGAFTQCRTCHQVAPGKHGIGPSLAGVFGAPAGAAKGYAFSSAMTTSGLTWDEATLDRFIAMPSAAVPGTRMVYPGLKDPAGRAEVIAYLRTL